MSGNKSEGMLLCVRSYAEASEWSRNGDGPDKNRLVLMPLEVLVDGWCQAFVPPQPDLREGYRIWLALAS